MSHSQPSLKRKLKNFGKQTLRNLFEVGQGFGINILPRHFYSEIPEIRELRQEEDWKQPRSLIGVNGKEIEPQLAFVRECCPEALQERQKKGDIYSYACSENGELGYGPIEADFLFCFIYSKRPKRVVQIGCGVSTAVMMLASQEANYELELICIDPYPTEFLKKSNEQGKIRLLSEKAQKVPLNILTDLGENGMLFIDSTHTVKPGSEVNRIILDVLPQLKSGNYVHFHDIYFPYDYKRELLTTDLFFPNESTLLHAFLINNHRYCLKASFSMLHYAIPNELQMFLPNYQPNANQLGLEVEDTQAHFPSSTYLQVIE
jgi:hypothetical protein